MNMDKPMPVPKPMKPKDMVDMMKKPMPKKMPQ